MVPAARPGRVGGRWDELPGATTPWGAGLEHRCRGCGGLESLVSMVISCHFNAAVWLWSTSGAASFMGASRAWDRESAPRPAELRLRTLRQGAKKHVTLCALAIMYIYD